MKALVVSFFSLAKLFHKMLIPYLQEQGGLKDDHILMLSVMYSCFRYQL